MHQESGVNTTETTYESTNNTVQYMYSQYNADR